MEEPARNLTDADIDRLIARLRSDFFMDLGRGFWGLAWRGVILILIAVAAYGAIHK